MATGFLHRISDLRLTADEVADAVGLVPVTGSGGIEVGSDRRGGTAVGYRPPALQFVDVRPAVITNTGPKGEADFDDERYWVQVWRPAGGKQKDAIDIQPDVGNYGEDWWVPATNLAEWNDGTHDLATDGTVPLVLFRLVDQGGMERFVFSVDIGAGSHVALVKLTSTTGTGGLYGGVAYDVGSNGDDGAGDYTPPEGQTAGESVLIENQDEQGQPTHWAILGSYAVGVLQPGMSTEMVPRPVYTIPRGQYAQGLPLEYGDAEMDAPAATLTDFEGQDASYWDKRDETAPFSGAFSFVILTSIINNYSIDGKVYIKYRPASTDADGRLAYLGQAQNASFGVTS